MPTLEQVSDYLYQICDNLSYNGSNHFLGRCPLCGDSKKSNHKKRFNLHFDNENAVYWKCWNCGESGNFYELYAQLEGCNTEEAYKTFNTYNKQLLLNRIVKNNKNNQSNKHKIYNKQTFNYILDDCISINDTSSGYIQTQYYRLLQQFINTRYLDYIVYIAYKGFYKGRIIIPIWDGDDIVFFQARASNNDMEPKYLNPSVEKSNIIFNKENFNREKYIIITEGLIDAENIGSQGTTILGKELTQEFIDNISQYTNMGIIVAMDNDKDGIDKLNKYIKSFPNLLYFIMPPKYNKLKDLNDLVTNRNINKSSLYNFVVDNSYTTLKCRLKLMGG